MWQDIEKQQKPFINSAFHQRLDTLVTNLLAYATLYEDTVGG